MELLKAGRFDALDIDNLIEELGVVGTSSQHAIESHLINLILHLPQIPVPDEHYQPAML